MKRLLLLLLFTTGISNALNINIPDANFKAKLIQQGVDANSDGEISEFEAYNRQDLNVSAANITDLTGINYFVRLRSFYCEFNQITVLNLSGLSLLEYLRCFQNQIQILDLTQSPILKDLNCASNQISSLNLTGLTNLESLDYSFNQLPNLDVTVFPLLKQLYCTSNQITNLNLIGLTKLQYLYCNNNLLTSLNLTNLQDLEYVTADSNQILAVNTTNSTLIKALFLGSNQLTSLDLSVLPNLLNLTCPNNLIANLNLLAVPNLIIIDCSNNLLNNLNISNCNKIFNLNCSNNQLTTLGVTNLNKLDYLRCSDNLLTSLFIKNGSTEFAALEFQNNPNLQFICADENQATAVENKVNTYGYTNCVTNTYCFFTPGGPFNTITGTQIFDENNNGCDALDVTNAFMKMKLNDGSNQDITFTNQQGIYNFYAGIGNYLLSPDIENQSIFNVSPTSYNVNFTTTNNVSTNNFCLTANGVHPDLEIVIEPRLFARPGFQTFYILTYKNKGNQTLSGNVNLTYDEAVLDFFTSNISPNILTSGNLRWNYSNLTPFESRSIVIEFTANAPTSTPPLNAGHVLNFVATINPVSGDDLPLDNSFVYNQTVVNSYDPNDITCLEGDSLSPSSIGEYLHYVVQFENTGTAEAINVVVKNEIDTNKYDINTLQIMNASANVRTVVKNNILEFIFENINLAARSGNPPVGGHGDVLFKIKTRPFLIDGDSVLNKANIYFDYNFPIITNDAITTFATLSNSVFKTDESVSVYPNPTSSKININANNNIKSIELYDVQGRILQTILNANGLDLSDKTKGIYFLKITTDNGAKVEKIVKE